MYKKNHKQTSKFNFHLSDIFFYLKSMTKLIIIICTNCVYNFVTALIQNIFLIDYKLLIFSYYLTIMFDLKRKKQCLYKHWKPWEEI